MRTRLFLLLIFFNTTSLMGQGKYAIHYNKACKLRINSETKIGKETFYDVDFLNANNQAIKSMEKTAVENHSNKKGYDILQMITYHFFQGTTEIYTISIDPGEKMLLKTIYTFKNGKETGWESYSIKPKIPKDSFQAIIDKDLFLNYPAKFPAKRLTLETKMVKRFEDNRLVYKCYYERYGKLETATPAREQFFKYNNKGQLIGHISNPRSDAGGTAFMKQTFSYNDKGQLVERVWYENGRHQCTDSFEYSDNTIIESQRFYNIYGNGDPATSSTVSTVYKADNNGSYYSENYFRTKFSICTDLD